MSNTCGYMLVEIGEDGEPVFDESGEPIPAGSPVSIISLAVPAWGRTIEKTRSGIQLETEKGRRYVYRQFHRAHYVIPFDLLPSQLETLRTLDEAVDGDADPFLFTFDVDASPPEFIFVRKTADFTEGDEIPVTATGETPINSGSVVRRVRHILELSEEPTGGEVTA